MVSSSNPGQRSRKAQDALLRAVDGPAAGPFQLHARAVLAVVPAAPAPADTARKQGLDAVRRRLLAGHARQGLHTAFGGIREGLALLARRRGRGQADLVPRRLGDGRRANGHLDRLRLARRQRQGADRGLDLGLAAALRAEADRQRGIARVADLEDRL
jgi:hypothetical protein